MQRNIDGSYRPEFICFKDKIRQEEVISITAKFAEFGFNRIMFDDDLRDAFCYCNEHIYDFEGFHGKSRDEIKLILNGIITNPENEQLRQDWYSQRKRYG